MTDLGVAWHPRTDHLLVAGLDPHGPVPMSVWLVYTIEGRRRELRLAQALRAGGELRFEHADLVATVDVHPDRERLELGLSVEARAAFALEQVRWTLERPFRLLDDLEQGRFFVQGFQSWSQTRTVPATSVRRYALVRSFDLMNNHVDSPYWGRRDGRPSSYMGALCNRESTLLLGFIDHSAAVGEIFLDVGTPALEASLDYGGKVLAAGQRLDTAPLELRTGDPAHALEAHVDLVGRRMGAPGHRRSPVGWCSWYEYYTRVSEQICLDNLEALAGMRDLGVEVFQLDDGYQAAVGDWLDLNDRFPSGLAALTGRIRAAGHAPGVWLAPFFSAGRSRLHRERPELFLRDQRGRLVYCGFNPFWRSRCNAHDLSHPAMQDRLREVFSHMVAQGFDYFKIDFLFAGLRRGRPHDPSLSPTEAYRRGLAVIRETIGPDRFLLGCGAPLGPSIGFFDGMRVSEDIDDSWRGPWADLVCGEGTYPQARGAIRDNMNRSVLHRRWWLNDPDCLLLPEAGKKLTDAESRLLLTVLAMTGGMLFLSNEMAALPPATLALAHRVLPPSSLAATPPDQFERPWPEQFVMEGHGRRLVALVNWSTEPARRATEPGFDLWEELPVEGTVEVPPHGVRLLLVSPDVERPSLVGATHHLAALVDGRITEAWQHGTLRVQGRDLAAVEGNLWVRVPPAFHVERAPEGAERVGALLRVPVRGPAPWNVEIAFHGGQHD